MERNFNREDLLFCVRLVTEGSHMIGYRIEDAKITVNARSLLKLWKGELRDWDSNMLESQLHRAIENDELEKLTVPNLVKVLKARYYTPRRCTAGERSDVRYSEVELTYLDQIIEMIIKGKLFALDNTWKHLTLFNLVLEACEQLIDGEVINQFRSLKKMMDIKEPGHYMADIVQNMRGTFVVKPKEKDPRDQQIINLGNSVLRKLQTNRAASITLINNYKQNLNGKHRTYSTSQNRSA